MLKSRAQYAKPLPGGYILVVWPHHLHPSLAGFGLPSAERHPPTAYEASGIIFGHAFVQHFVQSLDAARFPVLDSLRTAAARLRAVGVEPLT